MPPLDDLTELVRQRYRALVTGFEVLDPIRRACALGYFGDAGASNPAEIAHAIKEGRFDMYLDAIHRRQVTKILEAGDAAVTYVRNAWSALPADGSSETVRLEQVAGDPLAFALLTAQRMYQRFSSEIVQTAHQVGVAARIWRDRGAGASVIKRGAESCCEACTMLYGTAQAPVVMRLGDLREHLWNVDTVPEISRISGEITGWVPVLGTCHVWCQCALTLAGST